MCYMLLLLVAVNAFWSWAAVTQRESINEQNAPQCLFPAHPENHTATPVRTVQCSPIKPSSHCKGFGILVYTGFHFFLSFPCCTSTQLDFKISHSFQTCYHLAIQYCKSLTLRVLDHEPQVWSTYTIFRNKNLLCIIHRVYLLARHYCIVLKAFARTYSAFKAPEKLTGAVNTENHTSIFLQVHTNGKLFGQTQEALQKVRKKMKIFPFASSKKKKKTQLSSQLSSNLEITEQDELSSSLVLQCSLSHCEDRGIHREVRTERKACKEKECGQHKSPQPKGRMDSIVQPTPMHTLCSKPTTVRDLAKLLLLGKDVTNKSPFSLWSQGSGQEGLIAHSLAGLVKKW